MRFQLGFAHPRILRSLQHRPFALLWIGQAVSGLGDSLYRVALAWWVLERTGSATAVGGILVCSFAPTVLFTLLGGVAVDRFRRPAVMLASDLLRVGVTSTIAVLAAGRTFQLWQVYAASLLFGTFGAFFQPAYTAVIPEITPRDALPSANALTGLAQQFAGIVGPGPGAAIVARWGTATAFGLDALSFLWSATCLAPLLGRASPPRRGRAQTAILADLREGNRFVITVPWLWVTIVFASLVNISYSGPWSVALPFLVKEHMHASIGSLGLVYSALSLGFALGAVWLGRAARLRRRGGVAYGGWIVGGAMTCLLGLPMPLVVSVAVVLIAGVAEAAFALVWTNTLQELAHQELLGRIASIDLVGSLIFLPAGYALTGWATDRLGPSVVFIIGGAATLGLAGLVLAHPAIHNLD